MRKPLSERWIKSEVLWRLSRDRAAVLALAGLIVLVGAVCLAPWITPHDPAAVDPAHSLAPPSREHWLGQDHLGRDVLSRILYGGRISLSVGLMAVTIGLTVGGGLGLVAGFYPATDNVIMRAMDVLMAFPYILRAIAIVAILGPGLYNSMIAIGIGGIPIFARLVRASLMSLREEPFFISGLAVGAGDARLILRYVLPNIAPVVIVYATMNLGQSILSSAILSFLGLGVTPPTPEWGQMVESGREFLRVAPGLVFYPCMAIFWAVLCLNILGDGLRDAWDPKLRQ